MNKRHNFPTVLRERRFGYRSPDCNSVYCVVFLECIGLTGTSYIVHRTPQLSTIRNECSHWFRGTLLSAFSWLQLFLKYWQN